MSVVEEDGAADPREELTKLHRKQKKDLQAQIQVPEVLCLEGVMSFHFPSIVLFQNVLSFSKCARFCECCFSFFQKPQLLRKICTFTGGNGSF